LVAGVTQLVLRIAPLHAGGDDLVRVPPQRQRAIESPALAVADGGAVIQLIVFLVTIELELVPVAGW
jgi:hypothetical protein